MTNKWLYPRSWVFTLYCGSIDRLSCSQAHIIYHPPRQWLYSVSWLSWKHVRAVGQDSSPVECCWARPAGSQVLPVDMSSHLFLLPSLVWKEGGAGRGGAKRSVPTCTPGTQPTPSPLAALGSLLPAHTCYSNHRCDIRSPALCFRKRREQGWDRARETPGVLQSQRGGMRRNSRSLKETLKKVSRVLIPIVQQWACQFLCAAEGVCVCVLCKQWASQ